MIMLVSDAIIFVVVIIAIAAVSIRDALVLVIIIAINIGMLQFQQPAARMAFTAALRGLKILYLQKIKYKLFKCSKPIHLSVFKSCFPFQTKVFCLSPF